MPQFRLSRRAALRGAGSVAIALPWLEIMTPEPARAAGTPAKRFLTVFTPGGSVLENWLPAGDENQVVLSPILKPLSSVMDRVLIPTGIDLKSASGEQNQSGIIAWLTGTGQAPNTFAGGPSIDQVLAGQLSGDHKLQSLQLAVRWGSGKSQGLPSPFNIANYADTTAFEPVAPRLEPQLIWQDLFGAPSGPSGSDAWDKSILDAVVQRYTTLSQRLGAADRARLEAHLQRIRELEARASQLARCTAPARVDTSDYDPASGLSSSAAGGGVDARTDAAIPKVGKFMIDMLVMALACDLTAVGSLQWSDTEAEHTFPWLGLNQSLPYYMNEGGYQPNELTTIFTWYVAQHAYLLQELEQVSTGSGSLLDETLIFFGSQLQNPATHEKTNMPFLLAGNGGGLRTNRSVKYDHASHNDLLVALFNLCGDTRKSFGTPKYCDGPLGGLT